MSIYILANLFDELAKFKVSTNSKVFLPGLMNMRETKILTSVIEIQRENWGFTECAGKADLNKSY